MRKPDLVIGPASDPYMLRWHLWRWRGWQLALHKICRSDDDRALHDHSGDNVSVILSEGYFEILSHEWQPARYKFRWPLVPYFRRAETPHRLVLLHGPAWSLWLRWPPRREWGFYCRQGWRHWKAYAEGASEVGLGCD